MPADLVDYKLYGDDMQLVEIELDPGESVRAEAGAMMYMGPGIDMQTNLGSSGGGLGKALFGGLKRALIGESFFITNFTHTGSGKGHVAFAAPYPGKIIPLELDQIGGEFICQKDSFICAAKGIDIDIDFTKKLGTGFFGVKALFCSAFAVTDALLFMRVALSSKNNWQQVKLCGLIRAVW